MSDKWVVDADFPQGHLVPMTLAEQTQFDTDQQVTAAAFALKLGQYANLATLQQKAQAALAANQTFLNLATPTNAQTLAQVQMLTRECTALIRIVISALDSTAGT
jgi:hypothetical protein